jgi:nucleotide-binding universal stress UspA family protein
MNSAPSIPRSILVPLDGSPDADHVLPFVERLGAATRARLLLLRVIADLNPAASHDPLALSLALSNQASSRRRGDLALSAVTDQLRGHGLPTRSVVARGDPADAILATAEKHHVDLIAMATQSRRGLDRVLFGSVADREFNVPAYRCSWRRVRPHAGQPDRPSRSWCRLTAPLWRRSRPSRHTASPWLCGVTCTSCAFAKKISGSAGEGYLRELATRMGTDGLSIRTHVVTGAWPSDAILRVVHDQAIGMLALATHGRGGLLRAVLGSVASETLARSDIPVLLVRPNAARSRTSREFDSPAAAAEHAARRYS